MYYPSLTPDQIAILGSANNAASETRDVIRKFHEAFDRHDPQAMEDLVADDCVI